jgi:aminopeptidase N
MPITALGIEFPGIIINRDEMYNPGGYVRGIPNPALLESTTAHEVAHQWFYNLAGNDQITEPWIDEGLAQHFTWLYYREAYGISAADSFEESFYNRWDRIERRDVPIGEPIRAYNPEEYGAALYGLAPLFFKDVSLAMGEARFYSALRKYVEMFRWKNGSGEVMLDLFESECGCDLSEIYEKWF